MNTFIISSSMDYRIDFWFVCSTPQLKGPHFPPSTCDKDNSQPPLAHELHHVYKNLFKVRCVGWKPKWLNGETVMCCKQWYYQTAIHCLLWVEMKCVLYQPFCSLECGLLWKCSYILEVMLLQSIDSSGRPCTLLFWIAQDHNLYSVCVCVCVCFRTCVCVCLCF